MTNPQSPAPPPRSQGEYPGMPTWVKWFLLVALVAAVLVVAVLLITGGDHGPGRHMSSHTPEPATDVLTRR